MRNILKTEEEYDQIKVKIAAKSITELASLAKTHLQKQEPELNIPEEAQRFPLTHTAGIYLVAWLQERQRHADLRNELELSNVEAIELLQLAYLNEVVEAMGVFARITLKQEYPDAYNYNKLFAIKGGEIYFWNSAGFQVTFHTVKVFQYGAKMVQQMKHAFDAVVTYFNR